MVAVISSRTPEGAPGECPVCGTSIWLEPSWPAGDAPCPNCGSLIWFDEEESRWTVDSDGDFVPPATTQPSVGDNIHAVFGHVQSLLDDVHVVGVHDWNVENIKQLIAGFDRFLATFEPLTASPQVRNRRAQIIGLLGALEALVHAYEQSAQARRSNQRAAAGLRRALRIRPLVTSVSRLANWVASALQPAHRADSSFGNVYDP